jgi:hypothetical protein
MCYAVALLHCAMSLAEFKLMFWVLVLRVEGYIEFLGHKNL